jgi:hypothetical protein
MATNAAKSEALGLGIDFEFEGKTFTVPPTSEWDLDVLENYEDGKVAATMRALLGADQWATYKETPRKVSDLAALFEAVQGALGISGN